MAAKKKVKFLPVVTSTVTPRILAVVPAEPTIADVLARLDSLSGQLSAHGGNVSNVLGMMVRLGSTLAANRQPKKPTWWFIWLLAGMTVGAAIHAACS